MSARLNKFMEFGKKIVAVGLNYKAHAAELGNKVPSKPLLFMKPTSAYITEGQEIRIPPGCTELSHEVELGLVIGKTASNVSESSAMEYVGGYILALDMTARDFQEQAKAAGAPWLLAKGFDTSCPVSRFIEKDAIDPTNVQLWLKVNGVTKQDSSTKDMIFSIPYIISYISQYCTLEPGDVILTGTPPGVGQIKQGDVIEAGMGDTVTIKFGISKD